MFILGYEDQSLIVAINLDILFIHETRREDTWKYSVILNTPLQRSKPRHWLDDDESENPPPEPQPPTPQAPEKIQNIALSACRNFLAFSLNDKSLFLAEIQEHELKVHSRRKLNRNSSAIRFAPNGTMMLVADKAGDCYLFGCGTEMNEAGRWILGHVSQILDVAFSVDQRYVVTCDRDEKIKVTRYPETHEIETFCLGHKEFVSAIEFLPHVEHVLVSVSGDCRMKLWNYMEGNQLYEVRLPSPAAGLLARLRDETSSFLAVLLKRPTRIQVYSLETSATEFKTEIVFDKTFEEAEYIASFAMDREFNIFYLIIDKTHRIRLCHFKYQEDGDYEEQDTDELNIAMRREFGHIKVEIEDTLEQLYKKKFDNVKEYQERKRRRIEESGKGVPPAPAVDSSSPSPTEIKESS